MDVLELSVEVGLILVAAIVVVTVAAVLWDRLIGRDRDRESSD